MVSAYGLKLNILVDKYPASQNINIRNLWFVDVMVELELIDIEAFIERFLLFVFYDVSSLT